MSNNVSFDLRLAVDSNFRCMTAIDTQVGETTVINATILEKNRIKTDIPLSATIKMVAIIENSKHEKFKITFDNLTASNGVVTITDTDAKLSAIAGVGWGEIYIQNGTSLAITNKFRIKVAGTNTDDVGNALEDVEATYASVLEMVEKYDAGELEGMTDEQAEQLETNTSNIASLSSQLDAKASTEDVNVSLNKSDISLICTNSGYFKYITDHIVSRNDGGVTLRSDFIPVNMISSVYTNSNAELPPILYFSEKNIESYISCEFGDTKSTVTGWYSYNAEINPPDNAKYIVIQWNSNAGLQFDEYSVTGKIFDFGENLKETLVGETPNYKNDLLIYNLRKRYRYLMLSFGYQDMKLSLLGSNDLENFCLINKTAFTTTKGQCKLRDPAVIQIDDWYYITYSDGFPNTAYIYMLRTKNFIDFEELEPQYVRNTSNEPILATWWAPCWFEDGFKKYIVVSTGNSTHKPYYGEFQPSTNLLTNFKEFNFKGFTNVIDTHLYKVNGKYYAIIKDESVTTNNLHLMVSDSLEGEFTEINIGLSAFGYAEGQSMMILDNGHFRIFAQQLGVEGRPISFIDIANLNSNLSAIDSTTPIKYNDTSLTAYKLSHPVFYDFNKFGTGF